MKSRSSSLSSATSKTGAFPDRLLRTRQQADAAAKAARVAKAVYKQAKQEFKAAKKIAKETKKELKALLRHAEEIKRVKTKPKLTTPAKAEPKKKLKRTKVAKTALLPLTPAVVPASGNARPSSPAPLV